MFLKITQTAPITTSVATTIVNRLRRPTSSDTIRVSNSIVFSSQVPRLSALANDIITTLQILKLTHINPMRTGMTNKKPQGYAWGFSYTDQQLVYFPPPISLARKKASEKNSSSGKPRSRVKVPCAASTITGAPQAYTWCPDRSEKSSNTAW